MTIAKIAEKSEAKQYRTNGVKMLIVIKFISIGITKPNVISRNAALYTAKMIVRIMLSAMRLREFLKYTAQKIAVCKTPNTSHRVLTVPPINKGGRKNAASAMICNPNVMFRKTNLIVVISQLLLF